LPLRADGVVSDDSDLLELKSYMSISILTPRELLPRGLLEQVGEAPGEWFSCETQVGFKQSPENTYIG
jgi:hypothetical protein